MQPNQPPSNQPPINTNQQDGNIPATTAAPILPVTAVTNTQAQPAARASVTTSARAQPLPAPYPAELVRQHLAAREQQLALIRNQPPVVVRRESPPQRFAPYPLPAPQEPPVQQRIWQPWEDAPLAQPARPTVIVRLPQRQAPPLMPIPVILPVPALPQAELLQAPELIAAPVQAAANVIALTDNQTASLTRLGLRYNPNLPFNTTEPDLRYNINGNYLPISQLTAITPQLTLDTIRFRLTEDARKTLAGLLVNSINNTTSTVLKLRLMVIFHYLIGYTLAQIKRYVPIATEAHCEHTITTFSNAFKSNLDNYNSAIGAVTAMRRSIHLIVHQNTPQHAAIDAQIRQQLEAFGLTLIDPQAQLTRGPSSTNIPQLYFRQQQYCLPLPNVRLTAIDLATRRTTRSYQGSLYELPAGFNQEMLNELIVQTNTEPNLHTRRHLMIFIGWVIGVMRSRLYEIYNITPRWLTVMRNNVAQAFNLALQQAQNAQEPLSPQQVIANTITNLKDGTFRTAAARAPNYGDEQEREDD